ncbi:hypothetical protein FNV43_RR15740 [Rhamnella rubrinervis]|uniref:Uncharacterized protein n=1 Tax=Rhamnella rubrinervis TaxID=2594499 RepID=A0A8K0E9M8_9ROSA|nr:hypothetical protein FNV43_RR15740 [Rhamnella rubrinervis]
MRNPAIQKPEVKVATNAASSLGYAWQSMRVPVITPLLSLALMLCSVMSIMLFIERVYMALIILCVKLLGKKIYTKYKLENMKEDLELNKSYPVILVQIPMHNEKEEMVELECIKWTAKGVNVKYETGNNRNDFQPDEDFLWRTTPHMLENPELGLVQARWKFVNADECLMTRLQEMSLDYHFSVEQEVGSSTSSFFGFNGTAGVWRIQAIKEAGGWKDRTSGKYGSCRQGKPNGLEICFCWGLRSRLKMSSQVPSRLIAISNTAEGIHIEETPSHLRFAHWVTFFFYCIIIPASVLVPELQLTKPIAIYIPATITILNAVCTPRSLHLVVFWILFENVMSLHRTKAAIIGLPEANRVNEWIATEKLGNTMKQKNNVTASKKPRSRTGERFHILEMIMGTFMLHCAIYDLLYGKDHFFIYLLLQAGAFFIMGFGYVGTFVPN